MARRDVSGRLDVRRVEALLPPPVDGTGGRMIVDFQHHYTPPELLKGTPATGLGPARRGRQPGLSAEPAADRSAAPHPHDGPCRDRCRGALLRLGLRPAGSRHLPPDQRPHAPGRAGFSRALHRARARAGAQARRGRGRAEALRRRAWFPRRGHRLGAAGRAARRRGAAAVLAGGRPTSASTSSSIRSPR